MLFNYLTTSLRHLRRRYGYALINLFGLTIAMACCLLMVFFVRSEMAVNTVFPKADHLYRIDSEWREKTMGLPITTLAPAGETLVEHYPEVIRQTRSYLMSTTIQYGENSMRRNAMIIDPDGLAMFDLPLQHGDAATALSAPRSIVLKASFATVLFGDTDVLGQTVQLETWNNGLQPYTITGIWEDLPYNAFTYFAGEGYDFMLSPPPGNQDFIGTGGWTSWDSRYMLVFVELDPAADVSAVQARLDTFIPAYAPPAYHDNLQLHLNPVRTLYLTGDDNLGWRMVALGSGVALLLLLIASINFTNLSTVQSFTRAREIGVRKTMGAHRRQILVQFLGESTLVCACATLAGALLASAMVTPFFAFVEKPFVLATLWDSTTLLTLIGVVLAVGIMAGAYPALVLAGFEPTQALKGMVAPGRQGRPLREGLVVAQFAVAIGLLIAVHTIFRQLDYALEKDLGFDKEQVVVIDSVPRDWTAEGLTHMQTVKRQLAAVAGVQAITLTYDTPTMGSFTGNTLPLRHPGNEEAVNMTFFRVDDTFLDTYALSLQEGRFFMDDRQADAAGIVLNTAAVQALGLTQGVGETVLAADSSQITVVGVVDDFHFASLHEPIRPIALIPLHAQPLYRMFSVRLAPGRTQETLAALEARWHTLLPEAPFTFTFLDDRLNALYKTEQKVVQVMGIAALLAILIACMGMMGMASLRMAQRTKELGVRKVLGATSRDLLLLLTTDFSRPVLYALLFVGPLAYLAMDRWLQQFAYHVGFAWSTMIIAGMMALLVTWITVGLHTLRAAYANPVESLRYE